MDFLVNDFSFHGQFHAVTDFEKAIGRAMKIRRIAAGFGRELFCHRNLLQTRVVGDRTMNETLRDFPLEKKRAIMPWLTKQGPFWEDIRRHDINQYLECNGEIVTDTAVGEAGWCCLHGIDRALVSVSPSDWEFAPVVVQLKEDAREETTKVENYWLPDEFRVFLEKAPISVKTWKELEGLARTRFVNIILSERAFEPLAGHPFSRSASERMIFILDKLNQLKTCFDEDGARTSEGHQIYRNFFEGKKGGGGRGALFSDSSDSEKNEFKGKMTFPHPEKPGERLFCPWHGKIQTPPYRVHFSWPITKDDPLYVVYIGPKITKK